MLTPLRPSCITLTCDSSSAFKKILSSSILTCRKPYYDIASSIKALFLEIPQVKIKLHHVDGHQDQHKSFSQLDMWAKENYWCDQEAGNYRDLTSKQSYDGSSLPLYKSPWTIWVKEILVLDDLHEVIDEIIQEANAINYWRKHKYSASSLKDVNRPAIATTYKGLPFSRQTWSTKQASDWAPTNKNMKRWRLGRTEKCPFCGKLEDSLHHVQTCSHPEPSSYRRSKLKDLPSKLMKLHTSPPAVTALLAGLRKVWNEVPNISSYFTANWSQHITDSHWMVELDMR